MRPIPNFPTGNITNWALKLHAHTHIQRTMSLTFPDIRHHRKLHYIHCWEQMWGSWTWTESTRRLLWCPCFIRKRERARSFRLCFREARVRFSGWFEGWRFLWRKALLNWESQTEYEFTIECVKKIKISHTRWLWLIKSSVAVDGIPQENIMGPLEFMSSICSVFLKSESTHLMVMTNHIFSCSRWSTTGKYSGTARIYGSDLSNYQIVFQENYE